MTDEEKLEHAIAVAQTAVLKAQIAAAKVPGGANRVVEKLAMGLAVGLLEPAMRRFTRVLADDIIGEATGLAAKINDLPAVALNRREAKFGRMVKCPKAGLFAAAAKDRRLRKVALKLAGQLPPDPRRCEVLHGRDFKRWLGLSPKEKRAANDLAARRMVAVEMATRFPNRRPRYDLM